MQEIRTHAAIGRGGTRRTLIASCALRCLRSRAVVLAIPCTALLAAQPASAQCPDDRMQLYCSDRAVIRVHFQAGVNLVAEDNLFWDLADSLAPDANFDSSLQWVEAYILPAVSASRTFENGLIAYGKMSLVASGTLGTDAFDTGDTGRVSPEEGYVGLRARTDGGRTFDLSVGPRELMVGTGMLLSNGGSSGFARGALKLGPHRSWGSAAIARAAAGGTTATAFFMEPNEIRGNDSHTRIVGADVRLDRLARLSPESPRFIGGTAGHVLSSSAPYPKAAPGGIGVPSILPGARDGLSFATFYASGPLPGAERLALSIDAAYEWNPRIDLRAWAGRGQVSYVFASRAWLPTLSYSFQTFSGDDPATSRLERFDPLYYEGSPSAWATGSKSAMVFINSNVHAHQAMLRVTPTRRDTVTLRYARIGANKLLSPIQFGQATRVEQSSGVVNPIAGVTRRHLSDDGFLEYIRAITPMVYLTSGISASVPGAGMDSIITTVRAPVWTGGFVNVVVNF